MSDMILTEEQFEEAVLAASRRELLRVKRAADRAIAKAHASGIEEGRREVNLMLKGMTLLNGHGPQAVRALGRFMKAEDESEDQPSSPSLPPDLAEAYEAAAYDLTIEAKENDEDPAPRLAALAGLLDDPEGLAEALGDLDSDTIAKAVGQVILLKGNWDESKHPRSKDGRFISKDAIADAKSDPAKADALRARVKPEDAEKLEDALSGKTDLGRTKKGEAKEGAKQRAATKAERLARVKAIRIAIGDRKHTKEDLLELAEHLPHLSIAELRKTRERMAQDGAGFGGAKRKEGMVAALVEHAKRIAGEDAAGDSSSAPVSRLHSAIDSADLSDEQRQRYRDAVTRATERMPEAVHERIGKNLSGVTFHGDNAAMSLAAIAEARKTPGLTAEDHRWLDGLEQQVKDGSMPMGGAYLNHSRTLQLDGDFSSQAGTSEHLPDSPIHQLYAHELGHAIDGPDYELSNTPEWQDAMGEVAGLTEYAGTDPSEGFAEFARLLYASDMPRGEIEEKFPQASQFFKDRGLWAEEPGKGKMGEVFSSKVPLGTDGSHIDQIDPLDFASLTDFQGEGDAGPRSRDPEQAATFEDAQEEMRRREAAERSIARAKTAADVKGPGEVYSVPTGELNVDPSRFQFKLNTDKSGVTAEEARAKPAEQAKATPSHPILTALEEERESATPTGRKLLDTALGGLPNYDDPDELQRGIARRIASAHRQGSVGGASPEDLAPLERLAAKHGMTSTARAGETATFDGDAMESETMIQPGQPVRIVHPGFHMTDRLGVYRQTKAKVEPAPKGAAKAEPKPAEQAKPASPGSSWRDRLAFNGADLSTARESWGKMDTKEKGDFARQVGAVYRDASPEERTAIREAFLAAAPEAKEDGKAGDTVPFDATLHDSDDPNVRPGDLVQVQEPALVISGYLKDGSGKFMVARAKVANPAKADAPKPAKAKKAPKASPAIGSTKEKSSQNPPTPVDNRTTSADTTSTAEPGKSPGGGAEGGKMNADQVIRDYLGKSGKSITELATGNKESRDRIKRLAKLSGLSAEDITAAVSQMAPAVPAQAPPVPEPSQATSVPPTAPSPSEPEQLGMGIREVAARLRKGDLNGQYRDEDVAAVLSHYGVEPQTGFMSEDNNRRRASALAKRHPLNLMEAIRRETDPEFRSVLERRLAEAESDPEADSLKTRYETAAQKGGTLRDKETTWGEVKAWRATPNRTHIRDEVRATWHENQGRRDGGHASVKHRVKGDVIPGVGVVTEFRRIGNANEYLVRPFTKAEVAEDKKNSEKKEANDLRAALNNPDSAFHPTTPDREEAMRTRLRELEASGA